MHFLNNSIDKNNFKLQFIKQLEEKKNEYIKNGIIVNEKIPEDKPMCKNIQIKINKELIENFNEKLLLEVLNINNKLKLYYDIKYNIIYSVLLKEKGKRNISDKNTKDINNIYEIKKKNVSYFLNEYLIIKCLQSGEYGNIYYCKDVLENKKYCLKMFYLELCLKKNCPYYINNDVYVTNYFHKILSEIFFLNYLNNKNIIKIKNIFFDKKKKILCIVFPYVKYQSMHYIKRYGIYSMYKKVNKIDNYIEIFLYSEKFIRFLFLKIYNILIYLLKKKVAYLDLKPDNILLTSISQKESIPFLLKLKEKKKSINENSLEKNIELQKLEQIICKKLNRIQKIPNQYDKKNLFHNSIFSRKKKKKKILFCFFKKLSLKKLKSKKIKYIYNVNLYKCIAYDKNVKRIFFKKNKLVDVFFSSNDSNVFIQTFVQKSKNCNFGNLNKSKKNVKKNKSNLIKKIKKDKICLNKYKINKIRNLSIFIYNKKDSINFLKFYWLYFNEERKVNNFLIYIDIYFINRYFYKKIIKKSDTLIMNQNKKKKTYNEKNNAETEQNFSNENKKRKISSYNRNIEIHEVDKERACNFSNNEDNQKDFIRLIDFDTCAFILKNSSSYTEGTNLFNSFECLFNFTNTNIQFSKKLSYNFGSVLYTFLFGRTPYYGNDIFEIYNNMKKNKLIFPKYRKINKSLKNLLRKLLDNNPDNRIQFKIIKQHKWFTNNE